MRRGALRLLPVILLAVAAMAAGGPAHAALNLCNRTSYILYAATATLDAAKQAQVRGWSRIVPGECVAAISTPLSRQPPGKTYLVHARSALAHSGPSRAWGGTHDLCVRGGNFTLAQKAGAPCTDGAYPLGFAVVNTEGLPDWTMTFDQQPPIATLQNAQLAGVRRLLGDNGYKVGPQANGPDKATGAALAAFRKAAVLGPDAGNAQLFTALETGARKRVAPAGLTACNDGPSPLLVALGHVSRAGAGARGWWTVAAGACARLQTTALPPSGTKMFVLAQRPGGETVRGGGQMFCIADAAFEISGTQGCAARGFAQAGFAPLDTGGAPGLIVHLGKGAGGPAQTGMLK